MAWKVNWLERKDSWNYVIKTSCESKFGICKPLSNGKWRILHRSLMIKFQSRLAHVLYENNTFECYETHLTNVTACQRTAINIILLVEYSHNVLFDIFFYGTKPKHMSLALGDSRQKFFHVTPFGHLDSVITGIVWHVDFSSTVGGFS